MTLKPFRERILDDRILILDGATGTELQRRGFDLSAPGWSASAIRQAPDTLLSIHREYAAAGAEILTANTFRTHARNLKDTEWAGQQKSLTFEAVQIAREAAGTNTYVAGSIAPLEDCYSPEQTPDTEFLIAEHREMIDHLVHAGVDLIIIETQLTIREATTIAHLCQERNLPYFLSFTSGRDGNLLSGETIRQAASELMRYSPLAVLFNCLPVEEVAALISEVRTIASELPLGVYANTGRLTDAETWEPTQGEYPAVYAEFAKSWKEFGIKIIGGCCGTTPKHISDIHQMIYDDHKTPS